MVFYVKLGYLCPIYIISCVFSGGGGKLKEDLKGGDTRCKSSRTSALGVCIWFPFANSKVLNAAQAVRPKDTKLTGPNMATEVSGLWTSAGSRDIIPLHAATYHCWVSRPEKCGPWLSIASVCRITACYR
jgi:hypothetical protein